MRGMVSACVLVVGLIVVLCCPATAAAATCGRADGATGEAPRATLALNGEASTLERQFKRKMGTRTFEIVYDVSGCELLSAPSVTYGPVKDADNEFPTGLIPSEVQPGGGELTVKYVVDADAIDPGEYGATVTVRDAATLTAPARTAIRLSRSERWFFVPGLIGVVAGALGFLVLYLTKRLSRYTIVVSRTLFLGAAAVACGAGAFAAVVNWLSQDIWVWQDNWKGAATTAFTQATAGVMVALLAGVFSEKPAQPVGGPPPAPVGGEEDGAHALDGGRAPELEPHGAR